MDAFNKIDKCFLFSVLCTNYIFKVGLLLVATLNKKCLKITTTAIRELAPPSEKILQTTKKLATFPFLEPSGQPRVLRHGD